MQLLSYRTARGGYTIVELLIGLVMAGILTLGVLQVFISTQRFNDALAQRVDVQQNLRTGMAVLSSEIRGLNAVDGDLKAMSATSLTIRGQRLLGIVCAAPVMGAALTARIFTVRRPIYSGVRDFAALDSIFVWNEGDSGNRADDGWIRGRVTAVLNQNCTDGTPGQRVTADFAAVAAPMVNVVGGVPLGAPVLGFFTYTYGVGQTAGRWYINLTDSTGTNPIVGPLTGNTGVTFSYFNAAGAVTAVPAQVAQIGITLREQSVRQTHQAGGSVGFRVDSMTTRVTLRNNPRY